MELLGLIEFTSELTEQRWEELLAKHPDMVATDSIQMRNPYTENIDTITSARQLADVISDGVIVGGLRWCIDDSGIQVVGEARKMNAYAEELAKELGSRYTLFE